MWKIEASLTPSTACLVAPLFSIIFFRSFSIIPFNTVVLYFLLLEMICFFFSEKTVLGRLSNIEKRTLFWSYTKLRSQKRIWNFLKLCVNDSNSKSKKCLKTNKNLYLYHNNNLDRPKIYFWREILLFCFSLTH